MKTKTNFSASRHSINWLIASLSLGALPHLVHQPFWVGVMFVVMMGWRLLHNYRNWPLPAASRWLKLLHNGTAVLIILLLFNQFGLTIGRDAGVALLTIMIAFKTVEIKTLRDYYLTVFLGFFLVITNFFYSQSILMVLLMLAVVVLLTSCLLSINTTTYAQTSRDRLILAGKMVVQAIPVMLILFVLFPRIPGPIWGLPEDANTASSGLDEDMSPGSISKLIQSDEIAFRVEFENNHFPSQNSLYWRGPVLWQTDGRTWTPLRHQQLRWRKPTINRLSAPYSYKITLEPHDKNWLFALDMPSAPPQSLPSLLTPDGRLISKKNIQQRVQYALLSSADYRFNHKSDPNLKAALQLPAAVHPKAIALSQQWKAESQTAREVINKALTYFAEENFSYTLTPPTISGDTIDGFLFDSRQGFCEHYAASFTVLMRAAGIPARVVTGYLGGELNPVDNIMIVRQRDAHAWSEVWLASEGWVRIDPTAAVSSQRIEDGMTDLLPVGRNSPVFIARSDALREVWQTLKNNWDAFNSAWDMWIVAYGPERQLELLSLLGMQKPDWQKMAMWLASLLFASGLIMLLFSFYRRRHPDPAINLYQRFCYKLHQIGIERQDYEGPYDFALRAQTALPGQREQIQEISELYSRLRYGRNQQALLHKLKARVRDFHPGRQR